MVRLTLWLIKAITADRRHPIVGPSKVLHKLTRLCRSLVSSTFNVPPRKKKRKKKNFIRLQYENLCKLACDLVGTCSCYRSDLATYISILFCFRILRNAAVVVILLFLMASFLHSFNKFRYFFYWRAADHFNEIFRNFCSGGELRTSIQAARGQASKRGAQEGGGVPSAARPALVRRPQKQQQRWSQTTLQVRPTTATSNQRLIHLNFFF